MEFKNYCDAPVTLPAVLVAMLLAITVGDKSVEAPEIDRSTYTVGAAIVEIQISSQEDSQDEGIISQVSGSTTVESNFLSAVNLSSKKTTCIILPNSSLVNQNLHQPPEVKVINQNLRLGDRLYISDRKGESLLFTNDLEACRQNVSASLASTPDKKMFSYQEAANRSKYRGNLMVPLFSEKIGQAAKIAPIIFTNIAVSESSLNGQFAFVVVDGVRNKAQDYSSSLYRGAPVFNSENKLIGNFEPSKQLPDNVINGSSVKLSLLKQALEYKNYALIKFILSIDAEDINGIGLNLAVVKSLKTNGNYNSVLMTNPFSKT